MKVRLVSDLQLIITPENYVEHLALKAWLESGKPYLVEGYPISSLCTCHVSVTDGVSWCVENSCPIHGSS
jgi:hypothetical protein